MTWMATSSGKVFDLLDPSPDAVDFTLDVAPALARIPRFCGHLRVSLLHPLEPEPGYSVAQHCVLGAEALLTRSRAAQGVAAMRLREAAFLFRALRALKATADCAIMSAAGCDTFFRPDAADIRDLVAAMDLSMLRAERDALLTPTGRRWDAHVEAAAPVSVSIHPIWPAWDAARRWLDLFGRLAPSSAPAPSPAFTASGA